MHLHTHTHTHTHGHTYLHTNIHTYIHSYTRGTHVPNSACINSYNSVHFHLLRLLCDTALVALNITL